GSVPVREEPGVVKDQFGFLRYASPLVFDDVEIRPRPEYAELVACLDQREHRDGFVYPPQTHQVARDPTTLELGDEIPNTKRPAFLWRLPASHSIVVRTDVESSDFRQSIGLFIIHLVAYLFGTRLQFHDWWFDSRIPTKPQANIFSPARTATPFLSAAYRTWKGWSRADQ